MKNNFYPSSKFLKLVLLSLFIIINMSFSIYCYGEGLQQERTITGVVIDESGESIPGATVYIEGTTVGTITNADGYFSFSIPSTAKVLVVSFVGMKTQTVPIGRDNVYDITLYPDQIGLDELVVIGYGEQSRRHLTGSIETVNAEKFEIERPQHVTDILRGNAPGLKVGISSSAKGGGSLEIRGRNSLRTSTEPLIVLDGAIYLGALSDINPNDIQSIDIMKDASSAAIYGSRSANGVIQITTKRGTAAEKPIINFNSSVGISQPVGYPQVRGAHEFISWRSDLMKSMNYYNPATKDKLYLYDHPDNLPSNISLEDWREGLSGEPLDIWLSRLGLRPLEIENYKQNKSIDWAKMVYRNALRQDYNLSISGRTNTLSYYVSLGLNSNEGVVVGDQFKTIRNRINIDADVTGWLKVGVNSQFAVRDESNVNAGTNIREISPWGSMYEDDGINLRLSPVDDLVAARNPLYNREFTSRLSDITTINSTLFALIKLPFGISYRANFSPRFNKARYFNHQSSEHQEWGLFGGQVNREHSENFTWQLDNIINWNNQFNGHKFDATFLINAEQVQTWSDFMSVQDFSPSDILGFHNVSAGNPETRNIGSDDTYATRDALMGRLNYSYRDRYMATLALRRDGYSAFGMMNPRAYFPTASLGWVFSEESILQNEPLTYGKLRLSWGENGNSAIGIYDALSPMTLSQYLYYSRTTGTAYEVNRLFINRMANHNLQWEKTRQTNIGLDFNFYNGKLEGFIDFYRSTTLDLLVSRSLPSVNAYPSVTDNLGKIENKGVEITLKSLLVNRPDFSWNASFNFTHNKNKIVSLYGNMEDVLDEEGNVIGQRESDDIANRWFIGKPIDVIWGPEVIGVWQLGEEEEAAEFGQFPGDFKLVDKNDDKRINQDDYIFQGRTEPNFLLNLRQEFILFKNFEIAFSLYSQLGYKSSLNAVKNSDGFPERQNSYVMEYWTPDNPTNRYARLFSREPGVSFSVYRNKSFVRLDQVSFAYTVPQKYLEMLSMKNLKLFVNMQNVTYWAPDWELTDPHAEGLYPVNYIINTYMPIGKNISLKAHLIIFFVRGSKRSLKIVKGIFIHRQIILQ